MRRIFTIILGLILITSVFFTVNVRADEEQFPEVQADEEHLPDVQTDEEQLPEVQAGEERLSDVQADEEQLSEVQADEEQLPEVQADEEQLPDIQQDEEPLSDVQEETESIYDMQTDEAVFSDVQDPTRYFYTPVYWGVENGIIAGFSDGTFRPAAQCTRAQAVTFLWRMAGKPDPGTPSETFSDVDKSTSGYKAILWASKYKITGGYSDGTFRPNAACTREHMITFLWRYAGKPEPAGGENKFSDIFESDYYCKAVLWASENGIANGNTDGTFRPKAKCQRGHAAAFLYRYAQIFGIEPHLPEPEIIPAVESISPDTKLPAFQTGKYMRIVAKGNEAFSVSADTIEQHSKVVLWEKSSGTFDKWIFLRLKENTYLIMNAASGLVLDDPDYSAEPGQSMQLWKMNKSKAQQWHLVDTGDGDGSVYFENASSGLFLDIKGGKYKNGTLIQQYTANKTAAQKFYIRSAKVTFNGSKYVGGYKLGFKDGEIVYDRIQNLNCTKDLDQLILVEAEMTGSKAVVSFHEKSSEGIWHEVIRTDIAYIGKNGLGKEKQGDKKTPVGLYFPDKAFGIKPDPGCKVSYIQVDETNYWVGDNDSIRFNQFVTTREFTEFRPSAGEHLIEYGAAYYYCLNIGYNKSCTPYKGSCLFLHCIGENPYTAGCVAVPEETMVGILRRFRAGAGMLIDYAASIAGY